MDFAWAALLLLATELHVCELHLSTCKALFNLEVESDQCESQPDWFVIWGSVLSGKRIDHMLVDERWVSVGQRIEAKFVVSVRVQSQPFPDLFAFITLQPSSYRSCAAVTAY